MPLKSLYSPLFISCNKASLIEVTNTNKENITYVLKHIFSTEEFAFENHTILWEALDEFENNSLDFSDALIARINQSNNCEKNFTFYKDASLSENFSLLDNL